jgi:hypothetical protein
VGKANYERVKGQCYSDLYRCTLFQAYWILLSVLGLGALVSDLVFLQS